MTTEILKESRGIHPPSDTRWIMRRKDLPNTRAAGLYRLTDREGNETTSAISATYRQVLEALRRSPLYCASPVRLSDVVYVLKREHGADIETLFFEDDTNDPPSRYGVYVLHSQVETLGAQAPKTAEAA
ncbi:hypothetical protein [Histidinibacterium aquaticum]|uniref:Uncharacterized protein n=1 Tax=Histidinibacterium aquaticum TaxID=2613962 RepID=A0A5J5GDP5_9RHOB|nr:hypothetical protein [Histidinibacterium aquaticum]KAA9005943.1 hypothetical protein F3S47_15405 [Histidinibacterium aquaticum]